MSKLDKILEAVRVGGWFDANPSQREGNYLDVDVAKQQVKELARELVGTHDVAHLIAKYGDGAVVYHNQEALIPVSTFLQIEAERRQKIEAL